MRISLAMVSVVFWKKMAPKGTGTIRCGLVEGSVSLWGTSFVFSHDQDTSQGDSLLPDSFWSRWSQHHICLHACTHHAFCHNNGLNLWKCKWATPIKNFLRVALVMVSLYSKRTLTKTLWKKGWERFLYGNDEILIQFSTSLLQMVLTYTSSQCQLYLKVSNDCISETEESIGCGVEVIFTIYVNTVCVKRRGSKEANLYSKKSP